MIFVPGGLIFHVLFDFIRGCDFFARYGVYTQIMILNIFFLKKDTIIFIYKKYYFYLRINLLGGMIFKGSCQLNVETLIKIIKNKFLICYV
jgi:hypothetical protein